MERLIERFEEKLRLWNGIPTSATFRNVFRIINPEQFLRIFMNWVNEVIKDKTGKQIIIDGKAIRGATEKCTNGNIPYIVSAYLADIGIPIWLILLVDGLRFGITGLITPLFVTISSKLGIAKCILISNIFSIICAYMILDGTNLYQNILIFILAIGMYGTV